MTRHPAALGTTTVETYDAFFRREYARLVTLAYSLSGSRETAEDIAQDALIVAYRRWDEIVRLDHPAAYVRRTCANLAVSSVRRRLVEARVLLRLTSRTPFESTGESDERFWTEVRRLPRRQAQAVALHYGCDLSVTDVAAAMGSSESSVKTHLHRARATLARRFGDSDATETLEEVSR